MEVELLIRGLPPNLRRSIYRWRGEPHFFFCEIESLLLRLMVERGRCSRDVKIFFFMMCTIAIALQDI